MTEVRVPWKPFAGEILVIEPDVTEIFPISALQVIPRRPDAPAGVLMTLRLLVARDFAWRRISDGQPIPPGTFAKQAGFEFDIFDLLNDGALAVVYKDPARDKMVVTRGISIIDWPKG